MTTTTIHAARPGLRSFGVLCISEAKMVIRDTAGLIVPLALPLLVLLTSAGSTTQIEIREGLTAFDAFALPIVLTMVLGYVGIINMPSYLAYYRRSGILRRLAVTPVSPSMVLLAQGVVSVTQTLLGVGFSLAAAFMMLGANPPRDFVGLVVAFALATAAMYSTGMIIAALAPTPNSAVAMGLLGFLGLGALGGMFGGPDALPEPLAEVGAVLPFGASASLMSDAWIGQPPGIEHIGSLAIAVVLGAAISAIFFRWD